MRGFFQLTVAAAVVAMGVFLATAIGRFVEAGKRPEPQYTYLIKLQDATVQYTGTGISNNGFCTTIYKGSRVDAVVCENHIIVTDPRTGAELEQH
jgi:hypothetical protein